MKINNTTFSVMALSSSTFVAGIVSYLYHPIMVRFLDLQAFAEFESLLSIINLIAVVVTAFSLFLVKEFVHANTQRKHEIFFFSRKYGFLVGMISILIYLCFIPFLSWFLKIEDFLLIFLTGSTLFFSFFGVYQTAYIQAEKRFSLIALLNVVYPVLRVGLGVALTLLGMHLFGVIIGMIVSQLCMYLIRFFVVDKRLNIRKVDIQKTEKILLSDFKNQKKNIINFLYSSVLLALFMNSDILFAKHFLEVTQAGIYAGVSVIAKFLIFILLSIEMIFYPSLTKKTEIILRDFLKIFALYSLFTIGALLFFLLFGEVFLHLFKPGFEKYIDYMYYLILYFGLLGIINLLVKTAIAHKKYFINNILLIGFIGLVITLYILQIESIVHLIGVFLIISILLFLAIFISLFLPKNNEK